MIRQHELRVDRNKLSGRFVKYGYRRAISIPVPAPVFETMEERIRNQYLDAIIGIDKNRVYDPDLKMVELVKIRIHGYEENQSVRFDVHLCANEYTEAKEDVLVTSLWMSPITLYNLIYQGVIHDHLIEETVKTICATSGLF